MWWFSAALAAFPVQWTDRVCGSDLDAIAAQAQRDVAADGLPAVALLVTTGGDDNGVVTALGAGDEPLRTYMYAPDCTLAQVDSPPRTSGQRVPFVPQDGCTAERAERAVRGFLTYHACGTRRVVLPHADGWEVRDLEWRWGGIVALQTLFVDARCAVVRTSERAYGTGPAGIAAYSRELDWPCASTQAEPRPTLPQSH